MGNPALRVLWGCNMAAMAVMFFRLGIRKYYKKQFVLSDYLTMFAIFSLASRHGMMHVATLWGTNQLAKMPKPPLSDRHIYEREIGSKVRLASRLFLNTYLWLLKSVLLLFLQRVIRKWRWERPIVTFYWVFFGMAYITVQVTTFTDCHPVAKYWVVAYPVDKCVRAYGQLITLGVVNIITDVMLVFLPLHVIYAVRRPLLEKLQLGALFSLSFFVIAITAFRVQQNLSSSASQYSRSTWVSVEGMAACFVAHAPDIYSTMRLGRDRPRHLLGEQREPLPGSSADGRSGPYINNKHNDFGSGLKGDIRAGILVERNIEHEYEII